MAACTTRLLTEWRGSGDPRARSVPGPRRLSAVGAPALSRSPRPIRASPPTIRRFASDQFDSPVWYPLYIIGDNFVEGWTTVRITGNGIDELRAHRRLQHPQDLITQEYPPGDYQVTVANGELASQAKAFVFSDSDGQARAAGGVERHLRWGITWRSSARRVRERGAEAGHRPSSAHRSKGARVARHPRPGDRGPVRPLAGPRGGRAPRAADRKLNPSRRRRRHRPRRRRGQPALARGGHRLRSSPVNFTEFLGSPGSSTTARRSPPALQALRPAR